MCTMCMLIMQGVSILSSPDISLLGMKYERFQKYVDGDGR